MSRGRLFGKNVLEGAFRAAPDEDLFLGELLVAVDDTTSRRYLFRIVDVTYGTEHREPGWAERVAGTLLADDARGDSGAHPLYEQERRTALARHPWAATRLRTYAARRLANTSTLRVSLAELTVDDLRTAYEWSRPQEEALFELERHYSGTGGLGWLLDFSQVDDLPGFRDVELGNRV